MQGVSGHGLPRPAGSRGRRKVIKIWAAVAAGLVVGIAVGIVTGVGAHLALGRLLDSHRPAGGTSAFRVLAGRRYGLNNPSAIAVDGTHIWVANSGGADGGSVTELNASNGSRIRTRSGGSYGLTGPYAIAVDGAHIWVVNGNGDSLAVLPAG
jgi:hypothetical protein